MSDKQQFVQFDKDKHVKSIFNQLFEMFETTFNEGGKLTTDDAQLKAHKILDPILKDFKSGSNPTVHEFAEKLVGTFKSNNLVSNAAENIGSHLKGNTELLDDLAKLGNPAKDMYNKIMDGFETKSGFAKTAIALGSGLKQQLAIVGTIMVFRPLIMLTDKAVPVNTRLYAATREFFTEFFGLLNVLIVGTAIERAATQIAYNKGVKKLLDNGTKTDLVHKEVKWWRGILDPIPKFTLTKGGRAAEKLMDYLNDTDRTKLPKELHGAKFTKAIFGGLIAVGLATAILTPLINNYVINEKVLSKIWTFFGVKKPGQSAGHGGAPKLDTTNAAAERMLAIMHRANPAQSLNMYQASQQNPYLGFSGIQRAHAPNPMARI